MKKLFYLVYVGIGVIILFQTSRLIGTVIERRLLLEPVRKSFSVETVRDEAWSSPNTGSSSYDVSAFNSPLFNIPEPGSVPAEEAQAPGDDSSSPLLRTYELNGVILLPRGKSIAIIRRLRERESQMYRKGEMLDNYEVVKIERQRVLLNDGLTTSALPMYYKHTVQTASRIANPKRQPQSTGDYDGAKQVKKVLSRSDVENRVFSKVNEILTQIAISPYMVNGQMEGLRLIRVPNESIVYELGGRSGDIIKRVNGNELKQVDQMYKLWENIKDDSQITVDLERKNQIFSYSFDIRE
jgi:type II secretion system protein C